MMGPGAGEVAGKAGLAGDVAETRLPGGQRARNSGKGFDHHDADREQVECAKPGVADPLPPPRDAQKDEHQAENYEADICRVEHDEQVSKYSSPEHCWGFSGGPS